jgi:hypothetical protein
MLMGVNELMFSLFLKKWRQGRDAAGLILKGAREVVALLYGIEVPPNPVSWFRHPDTVVQLFTDMANK